MARSNTALASLLDVRHTVYSLSQDWSTSIAAVGQFFYIFLLVVIVAVLAYYTTRLIGMAKYGRGGRRNLEIVESMGVGPQSFIHIVRIGESYVLVGVTRGQVTKLAELDADQLKLPEPGQGPSFELFMNRFERFQKDRYKKEDDDNASNRSADKDNRP